MQSINWNHIGQRFAVAVLAAVGVTLVTSCSQDLVTDPLDPSNPSTNSRPVADAGPDVGLATQATVTLDGSGSRDPDGDPLTYTWGLVAQPTGSGANLSDPTAMRPSFVADVAGQFVAQLVVSDGTLESTPDTVAIEATTPLTISVPSDTVGAGLQVEVSATLGLAAHGGVTVRIASGDTLLALIAPDANTPGAPFIDVDVPTGFDTVPYVLQGVAGSTGTVTVAVTAPGFTDGAGTMTVAVPAVGIQGLGNRQVVGRESAFTVVVGLPDTTGTKVGEAQGMSAGNVPALALTVASSNGAAGRVSGAGSVGDTISVELAPGVFEEEITFEPLAEGATVIAATVPGFDVLPSGAIDVTVSRRGVTAFSHTIGAGLQYGDSVRLDVVDHGGVTVRIESSDATVALVAPDANTAGAAFIDVVLADGDDAAPYVVRGVSGASGTATITASAPDFVEGTGTITVVQPALAIHELAGDQGAGGEDAFIVRFGVPDAANFTIVEAQAVSAATASPMTLTVTSSNGAVGDVSAGGTTGATLTLDITGGMDRADVTFHPRSSGMTTVSASTPGFRSTTAASLDVTVDTPAIQLISRTVGAALQIDEVAELEIANHGGVTVRIESSDPTVALIAPDVNTPGSAVIDVDVAAGTDRAPYVVQGVAGAIGTVTITASAPGFADGDATIDVVQPALNIIGLPGSASVGINHAFTVRVGLPNGAGTGLSTFQGMSAANVPPLVLTVTSSDGSVGQLDMGGRTGDTVTLDMTANMFQPSATFQPVAPGTTTISASMPGFLSAGGSVDVNVSAVNITAFSRTIGAGLQYGDGARFDSGNHSGVTVRIESSDPTVALIAPDVNTPGSPFVDVEVAAGGTFAPYVVQGVAGAVGRISVTASAPGFDTGVGTIDVVQPAVHIVALSNQLSVGAVDVFTVRVGVPHAAGTHLSYLQGMSAANMPPLVLTVTSSDGAVGQVSTGGPSGDTATLDMTAGMFQPNVTFEPSHPGTTTVSASIPGFITLDVASVDIVVEPTTITVTPDTVGAGLQVSNTIRLVSADHGGVTVRIESGDPALALIAPDLNTPGAAFLDVIVPDGISSVSYVLQGVAGTAGPVTVTAAADGRFSDGVASMEVVQPAVALSGLPDTVRIPHNDAFQVDLGIADAHGSAIATLQSVSAANPTPLVLTLTSSDATVGQVTDGVSSGSLITIDVTSGSEVAATFRPFTAGTTTVSASIPGFQTIATGAVNVTVANQ